MNALFPTFTFGLAAMLLLLATAIPAQAQYNSGGNETASRGNAVRTQPTITPNETRGSRGYRYGEVLLVQRTGRQVEAEVWGTQRISECPADAWEALDAEAIRAETGSLAVVLNGPRYGLMNSGWIAESERSAERRRFGDLEMRFLATVEVNPRQGGKPYLERTVRRSSVFVFNRGEEIYELRSPEGAVYVMQSMSQIVDPNLTLDDLSNVGSRLTLPDGWTWQARTLDADLILTAEDRAIVLQDDLRNTYQRR